MPEKIDIDHDDVKYLIEDRQLQQWKVAKMMNVSTGYIEKYCAKFGLKTQRTGPRSGEEHPDWKGGRKMVKGYCYIYCPDHPYHTKARYVAEHRLVMEQKLGRYLLPDEVVHHKDHNPMNNHPDNLMLFRKNADHLKHELKGKVPNWSKEGFENMCKAHPEWKSIRQPLEHGGDPQPQTTFHQAG